MNERISDATGCSKINDEKQWFVMRDLTRSNAKHPAYRMLEEKGLTYFTPMTWKIVVKGGKRERRFIPLMQDLLFVYDTRTAIDPIVARVRTFQYRFLRGTNREPMTVRKEEMERFIRVVKLQLCIAVRYVSSEESLMDVKGIWRQPEVRKSNGCWLRCQSCLLLR